MIEAASEEIVRSAIPQALSELIENVQPSDVQILQIANIDSPSADDNSEMITEVFRQLKKDILNSCGCRLPYELLRPMPRS